MYPQLPHYKHKIHYGGNSVDKCL